MMRHLLALALAASSCSAPLAAQLTDDSARRRAKEALDLQEQGHYHEAVKLTKGSRDDCGDDAACRHRLSYTLGYLHQAQSRQEKPEAARALLEESAVAYGAILDQLPAHWPTLSSLLGVYEYLAKPKEAEGALKRGLEYLQGDDTASSERRAVLALALGDLYRRSNVPGPELFEAYRMAADALPRNATPKRREIEAYDHLPVEQLVMQMPRLKGWEESHRHVAGEGYKVFVRRLWRENQQVAETALLRWLDLQNRWGLLDSGSLEGLPGGWTPIRDLESFVKKPSAQHFSPWWFENGDRSDAVASCILAAGRQQEKIQATLHIWETALARDLQSPPRAWAELYTELAAVLHQRGLRENENNLKVFGSLEDRLFPDGWEDPEQEVRNRLHAVFGLIYADLGRCGSSPTDRSAIFHLKKAIELAEQGRRDLTEPYNPAGHLQKAIAECYRRIDQHELALGAHFDAWQNFLDADQLELAAGQQKAVEGLMEEGYADRSDRRSGLVMVQFLRENAIEPKALPDGICSPEAIDWTLPGPDAKLPQDFLTRQRFKVRGDCIRYDNVNDRSWASAELLKFALEAKIALVGPEDLIRFERVNRVVLEQDRLELEIFSTDEPRDSGFELRLALHSPSPGRKYTYVKSSAQAKIRAERILNTPPRLPNPDEVPRTGILPVGTLLRVRLSESIDGRRIGNHEIFRGSLTKDVRRESIVVLATGSEVAVQAVRTCAPSVRSSHRNLSEGDAETNGPNRDCRWKLELHSVTVSGKKVAIYAGQSSLATAAALRALRETGGEVSEIPLGTTLDFYLRRPLLIGQN